MEIREKILNYIETNSRVDVKDLAVMLGVEETTVANEMAAMEEERIICGYHTLIDWEKTSIEKVNALIEVRVTRSAAGDLTAWQSGYTTIRRSMPYI